MRAAKCKSEEAEEAREELRMIQAVKKFTDENN